MKPHTSTVQSKVHPQQLSIDLLGIIIEYSSNSFSQLATWQQVSKSISSWIDNHCDRTWSQLLRVYNPSSSSSSCHQQQQHGHHTLHRNGSYGALHVQLLKYEAQTSLLRNKFQSKKNMCSSSTGIVVDPTIIHVNILGGVSVGKATLAYRFCTFDQQVSSSSSYQSSTKCYVHELDRVFNVNVQCTPSSSSSIPSQSSSRDANVFMIVHDHCNLDSLKCTYKILKTLQRSSKEPIAVLIVGNKKDVTTRMIDNSAQQQQQQQQQQREDLMNYVRSLKMGYYSYVETSALQYEGVDEAFQKAIVLAMKLKELMAKKCHNQHVKKNEMHTAQQLPDMNHHSVPCSSSSLPHSYHDRKNGDCIIL